MNQGNLLTGTGLPEHFYWFNAPPKYTFDGGLRMHTQGDTDFWQRTHYGFQRDSGHCLFTRVAGDFQMVCRVSFAPTTQYDQCGLMVRADENHWIKISTEYENTEISRLGSVVTNRGYSDWATQDVSSQCCERWYRVAREGADFLIESADDGNAWKQLRITHLHEAPEILEAGLYACSPKGNGCECCFPMLTLKSGDTTI